MTDDDNEVVETTDNATWLLDYITEVRPTRGRVNESTSRPSEHHPHVAALADGHTRHGADVDVTPSGTWARCRALALAERVDLIMELVPAEGEVPAHPARLMVDLVRHASTTTTEGH
jgi:hypothetical protein